jgi:hypothetical protein
MAGKTNQVKISENERLADGLLLRRSNLSGQEEIVPGQGKIQFAALYAETVFSDRDRGAKESRNNTFEVALADFLEAPLIEIIDISNYNGHNGSRIHISVLEELEAKSVFLKILCIDGQCIAKGFAVAGLFRTEWIFSVEGNDSNNSGDKIAVWATQLTKEEFRLFQ